MKELDFQFTGTLNKIPLEITLKLSSYMICLYDMKEKNIPQKFFFHMIFCFKIR